MYTYADCHDLAQKLFADAAYISGANKDFFQRIALSIMALSKEIQKTTYVVRKKKYITNYIRYVERVQNKLENIRSEMPDFCDQVDQILNMLIQMLREDCEKYEKKRIDDFLVELHAVDEYLKVRGYI